MFMSIWQFWLLPHFSTIAGRAGMLWLTFSSLSRATYNVVLFFIYSLLLIIKLFLQAQLKCDTDTLHWLKMIRKASYHLKCSKSL